jgi:signal transduction histidine kinase
MARTRFPYLWALPLAGVVLAAILAAAVVPFRREEAALVKQKIVERDADILYPEALQLLTESEAASPGADPADTLWPVTKTADQRGMLAVTIFDANGEPLHSVPLSLLLPEIPAADFPQLLAGRAISHYHPSYRLADHFSGVSRDATAPVLEVLLALRTTDAAPPLGFVQYYIKADELRSELDQVDRHMERATAETLGWGSLLIGGVLTAAYWGLNRAQRIIVERNERLVRANVELTLAAKVSALGQVTSDLIHGLQGSVAGLRAVTADGAQGDHDPERWLIASDYVERMQRMIQETVALLGDLGGQVAYELAGSDLAETIRQRNETAARERAVRLVVIAGEGLRCDSRFGSLLCLIATNLTQNAIAVTPAGKKVEVNLSQDRNETVLTVSDEGTGISAETRARLFEPGRSGRPGGTGLGLAISRLLARQLGGELDVQSTGPSGSVFALRVKGLPMT